MCPSLPAASPASLGDKEHAVQTRQIRASTHMRRGEEKARAPPAAPGQSSTLTALLPRAASVHIHRRRVTQLRFWVQRSEYTSFQRKKQRARDTEIQMNPSGKENPSFVLGVGRAPSSLSSEDGPALRVGGEAGLHPPSRESALWCPSRPRLSPRAPHTHTHTRAPHTHATHTHWAGSTPLTAQTIPLCTTHAHTHTHTRHTHTHTCHTQKHNSSVQRPARLLSKYQPGFSFLELGSSSKLV